LINIAINDLKHSVELYSDPKIHFHLAETHEFKMRDEKDNDKKAIMR